MRTATTYDEKAVEPFNHIPVYMLAIAKENTCMTFDINNGKITGASQLHRDYVWFTDGRKNFI